MADFQIRNFHPIVKTISFNAVKMQIEINPRPDRIDLEDYFILRLPEEDAAYLRHLIRTKPKKVKRKCYLKLDEQFKTGWLRLNRKILSGQMVHLPTITDVCKSTNGMTIYKTGTISQMFVIDGDKTLLNIKHDNWPHGLTKPLKNVRKQRFRKTMRNDEDIKEANNIQTEVTWLLRTDYEALHSHYEIIYEKVYDEDDITEEALFGSMSDTGGSEDSSVCGSHYDIMDFN